MLYDGSRRVLILERRTRLPDRFARICVLCLMLTAARAADAAASPSLSFDSLIRNSDLVVYGRVVQSRYLFDPASGLTWTETDIRILETLKGEPGSAITVSEPGGLREGVGEYYPGVPQFQPGQELVLFLYRASGNRLRVTGAMQGFYRVHLDAQTGERWVQPAFPKPESVHEAGSGPEAQMQVQAGGRDKLSRFLYDVRQKAAAR